MKKFPQNPTYATVEEMGLFLPQKKKYTMRDFNKVVADGWCYHSARWIVICSWVKYAGPNYDKCDISKKLLSSKFREWCKMKDMFS